MEKVLFEIYRNGSSEIYANDVPAFPPSDLWGHLGNKFHFILQRLEYLNKTIESIYNDVELYYSRRKKRQYISNSTVVNPFIEIIHLISDLRMIIDELISLLYILEKREQNGDYPSKIRISSIGELLTEFNKDVSKKLCFFRPYKSFLEKIKDISNTYKHSFINSDILFYKQPEVPIVYAGKNDYNNFNKERILIAIPLNEIVDEFNVLFKNDRELLWEKTVTENDI